MATRRERVVLELEDDFTSKMARAAAATAVLKREIDSLSKSSVRGSSTTKAVERDIDNIGKSSSRSGNEVDKLSGRLRILTDAAVVLTPALASVGAVGTAALSGLTSELGFAAIGAGTAVLAFHGLGDALKALDKAQLDPTVANLDALHTTLANLSPAARALVTEVRGLIPGLHDLQNVAQTNLFPGVIEGLHSLESTFPRVEKLVAAVAAELGSIASDAGGSLASERWTPFLDFLTKEAPVALGQMAKAAGNVTHAFAELWMATTPLNHDFSSFLVKSTAELDKWAAGLDQTQGFKDFVAYVRENGPELEKTIGAIANAFLQVVEAAAPLAGPVLGTLRAIANVVSEIAKSDAGTPIYAAVTAYVLLNRTLAISTALQTRFAASQTATAGKFAGVTKGLAYLTAGLIAFNAADSALHLSVGSDQINRMTTLLDAKAGPNIADQIAATKAEIARQQHTADNANIHLNLGITDIYSSDKAAKAADTVIGLKKHLADLSNQQKVNAATTSSYTLQIEKQNEALTASRAAATTTARQFVDFDSTLNDATVSLDDWTSRLAQQASALEHFATNAQTAANRGLRNGLIKELQAAGPEGALRMKQLADGTDAQIRRANRAWALGQRAIRDYTNTVGGVPSSKTTTLKVKTDQAKSDFLGFLKDISGHTVTVKIAGKPGGIGGLLGQTSADGSTVPKTGMPYADRHLYMLADGEEVISNRHGQADRWRPMLKAINGGLAGGGTVGDPTPDAVLSALYGGSSGGGKSSKAHAESPESKEHKRRLKELNAALAKSKTAIDKETTARDDLVSKRTDLSSTIGGSLTSDIFGDKPSNWQYFTATQKQQYFTQAPLRALTTDDANAKKYLGFEQTLRAKGLDGQAFAALASTGDTERLQAYAGLSRGDIAKYEQAFNQRARDVNAAGAYGGNVVYGPAIATANAQLAALNAKVAQLEKSIKGGLKDHAKDVNNGRRSSRSHTATQVTTGRGNP